MTTAEIMHFPAPPSITSSFALASAIPEGKQASAPVVSQDTPPPAPVPAASQETPEPGTKRRRIFLPLPPPPFKYRVKVGTFFPTDGDTKSDTGSAHLRLEVDAFPVRVQRGYFRGAAFFVTLGYSQNTQNEGANLRIGSASISQLVTLPGRPVGAEKRRLPSRTSLGASYGLYLLSVSGRRSGEDGGTNGHFGTDLFADYVIGKETFVELKYHTLFGGVKGYFGSGPSILVGHRF
jgi:hypothetical protein